jgi:hypothetical protein
LQKGDFFFQRAKGLPGELSLAPSFSGMLKSYGLSKLPPNVVFQSMLDRIVKEQGLNLNRRGTGYQPLAVSN